MKDFVLINGLNFYKIFTQSSKWTLLWEHQNEKKTPFNTNNNKRQATKHENGFG